MIVVPNYSLQQFYLFKVNQLSEPEHEKVIGIDNDHNF